MRTCRAAVVALATSAALSAAESISYYEEVRPLLQLHCSGCHQPANLLSGLDITSYGGILRGGSKHGASIVKGAPDRSPLVGLVTGRIEPRMPMGGAALGPDAVAVLERWVREGAEDDTPAEARAPQPPAEPPHVRPGSDDHGNGVLS